MDDKYYIKSLGFYNLPVKQLNFCFEKVVYLYRPLKRLNLFKEVTFGYKFVNLTFKDENKFLILTDNENDFFCLIAYFFQFLINRQQYCHFLDFAPINNELTLSFYYHHHIDFITLNYKDNPLIKLTKAELEQIYLTYRTLSYKLLLG